MCLAVRPFDQFFFYLQFWSKSDYPSWSSCPFFIKFIKMTKATFVFFFLPKLSSFIDWCCYYTQVSYTGSWEPLVLYKLDLTQTLLTENWMVLCKSSYPIYGNHQRTKFITCGRPYGEFFVFFRLLRKSISLEQFNHLRRNMVLYN